MRDADDTADDLFLIDCPTQATVAAHSPLSHSVYPAEALRSKLHDLPVCQNGLRCPDLAQCCPASTLRHVRSWRKLPCERLTKGRVLTQSSPHHNDKK